LLLTSLIHYLSIHDALPICITILNHLYKKKKYLFSMFPYWLVLTLAVLIKIFILFIQFPHLFLPGNSYFSLVVEYTSRFLLIFIDRKSTRLNSSHVSISYAV